MQSPEQPASSSLNRWSLFLALSRTQHGLLDLATPVLAALLWSGGFPPAGVMLLGIMTAFAGYTSVYALNDLVDMANDRAKMRDHDSNLVGQYLDVGNMRHPLAQGVLSLPSAVSWVLFWTVIALTGAYALNPVCLWLFLAGAGLEVVYCLLLKVTALRFLISGFVKTVGGIAAVFAVDPNPSPWFLLALWAWIFCWEIGGQNIPADWYDVDQDRRLGARTLPVSYGLRRTGLLALFCLAATPVLGMVVLALAPMERHLLVEVAAWVVGLYLLIWPAFQLWRKESNDRAIVLFNRASHYPLAILAVVLVGMLLRVIT